VFNSSVFFLSYCPFALCAVSDVWRCATLRGAARQVLRIECTDCVMPQYDAEKIKHLSITLASLPVTTHTCMFQTGIVAPPLCSAPLGILSVFHQWNLGITTHVMMFKMPSSEFLRHFSWRSHVAENLPYFYKRNLATLEQRRAVKVVQFYYLLVLRKLVHRVPHFYLRSFWVEWLFWRQHFFYFVLHFKSRQNSV